MNFEKNIRFRCLIKSIVIIVLVCFFYGCGGKHHGTEVYNNFSVRDKNTDSIASIMMFTTDTSGYVTDYIDWVKINGIRVDHNKYGEIRVVPGFYAVEWGRKFDVSPMIKASGSEKRAWSTKLTLEAGYTYTIHAKRTIGHGYKIYSWVTDNTQSKVIWGKKFIPGPYYYLRDS